MAGWYPPLWYDRLGGIAWRAVVIVIAVAMMISLAVGLSAVILPVVLGLLFACGLRPLADLFGRLHVPATLSAVFSVLVLNVALIGVVALTVNAVVDQWGEIELLIDEGRSTLTTEAADAGISTDTARTLDEHVGDAVGSVVDMLLGGIVTLIPTVAGIITTLLLSIVVAFFFVKDGSSMWRWIATRFDTADGLLDRIGQRVWITLTGYILGQTAIAAIDATLIALGAVVLGVPEPLAILVITFFGAYIPFIGATVAGLVAVLLAVADGGITKGLVMLGIVIGVQLLEGNLLQPWIQGRAVRLHPLVIALSITAGGALAGFLGVFLAVPITAAALIALSELRAAGVLGPSGLSATERHWT
jgi:predicted PurR-regulated permease PerM